MRFSLLACLVFAWVTTAGAAEPKPITAAVGHEFKITLPYNTTTGYQWVLVKPPDEKLARLLRSEYKRLDSNLMGASGDMTWTFKALAEGKTEMKLNYIRPWERKEKPARTTNFVVVIKVPKDLKETQAAKPGS
jgi:predicted secreted protein